MLDGCYVIKTDLLNNVDKKVVHDRYKDLSKVEYAFRVCKTALLELRPWYVQKEESTCAHAFIVMIASLITHHLEQCWKELNITVEEVFKRIRNSALH